MSRLILDQQKVQFIVIAGNTQITTPNALIAFQESYGAKLPVLKQRGTVTEPITWHELYARAIVAKRAIDQERIDNRVKHLGM
jgi:hypothetical protein